MDSLKLSLEVIILKKMKKSSEKTSLNACSQPIRYTLPAYIEALRAPLSEIVQLHY